MRSRMRTAAEVAFGGGTGAALLAIPLAALLQAACSSCSDTAGGSTPDHDAAPDADADTDGDGGADTDADSDGDTDTDTGTGADTDTDADTDAGTDTDTDTGTDTGGAVCVVRVDGSLGSYAGHDGSAWALALAGVQEGIDVARAAVASAGFASCAVWVAAGTYLPTTDAGGDPDPADPRTRTFVLHAGVGLYGGFAGDEAALEERDVWGNPAVLSGDLGAFGDGADNAYHVVTGADSATIDGFTIRLGNADSEATTAEGSGGGMYNDGVSPEVTSCAFEDNLALFFGGGMYNVGAAAPAVTGCSFEGNDAGHYGGGVYNGFGAAPAFVGCGFTSNTAEGGGGAVNDSGSAPSYVGCTFAANAASWLGGAMYNAVGTTPVVRGCAFSGNMADGGGAMANDGGSPAIESCVFYDNTAYLGGGVYNLAAAPTFAGCSFSANTASSAGAAICSRDGSTATVVDSALWGNDPEEDPVDDYAGSSAATVTFSIVQGGCTVAAGCTTDETGNLDADPLFLDPGSGDLHLQPGSPCVDAADGDAAPAVDFDGNPRVDDPATPDTGFGAITWADIGAFELLP